MKKTVVLACSVRCAYLVESPKPEPKKAKPSETSCPRFILFSRLSSFVHIISSHTHLDSSLFARYSRASREKR